VGYRRQKKIHKLTFDESTGDLAGLEVRVHSLTVGELMDMSRLTDQAGRSDADADEFFQNFVRHLVSWNVEDEFADADGVGLRPVPPTMEGVRSCDMDFIMAIVKRWMEAIAAVPDPLPEPSSGGPPHLEGSLPMDPLPSPPS
jgi:hypothetical protein